MTDALDAQRVSTAKRQGLASDPAVSAWVSANAGTGKTHVLTQRVLRLLLAGTRPERILCLTFTKAAAAEMSKRVFEELAQWVVIPDAELDAKLTKLTGRRGADGTRGLARTLFANAIETPGGLKVQTIHAFAERLLQRFPLEAGLTPGFKVIDDTEAMRLRSGAIDQMLRAATRAPNAPIGQALRSVVTYAVDDDFDDLIRRAVERERSNPLDPTEAACAALDHDLRRRFDVAAQSTRASLAAKAANVLDPTQLRQLTELLATGTKTDITAAQALAKAHAAPTDDLRRDALVAYFLTGEGQPRARLMTKALSDANMTLAEAVTRAQGTFAAAVREAQGLDVIDATLALRRLAADAAQRYADAKAATAGLDFIDLITKARQLVQSSDTTAWVLYKLDGGIDHVLVDEAQDTSAEQWDIVEALSGEFFSTGATAGAGLGRTVFAVGDEKQSIYGFQGAKPELFAAKGRAFAEKATSAGAPFHTVPLDLSFRSVAPVLDSVDHVFADGARTPGLTDDAATAIRHYAHRLGEAGLVEIWDTEKPDDAMPSDMWSPLEDVTPRAPASRLAERIAAVIEKMIGRDQLVSKGRPVRAGDILILVRRRTKIAGPMIAALKTRGIAVAGSDRMRLIEQIAVADLMAAGDFVTLPEDDLSLACLLKSPLLGLTDDDLMAMAPQRRGTLWKALLDAGDTTPRFKAIAETLKTWRSRADFLPPYEFYAKLLDAEGGRARMLGRLGPEAADAIDEFLDLALTYDDRAPPSLSGFLAWLRESNLEVKRDMELSRDEVRVMTVHGAKGLEAPIVFLPDTCSTASGGVKANVLIDLIGEGAKSANAPPWVWTLTKASALPPIAAAKARDTNATREEMHRLLYVAMTRAFDRLYVAGFETAKGIDNGCWYQLISDALVPVAKKITCLDGRPGSRIDCAQTALAKPGKVHARIPESPVPLPDFAKNAAPREPQLAIPLAPSRLEDRVLPDAEGEAIVYDTTTPAHLPGNAPSPLSGGREAAQLRGTLTHALLQYLPEIPQTRWPEVAKTFIARRGQALTPAQRARVVSETLSIMQDPAFAHVFGPDSRAEVEITADIPSPKPGRPPLRISGQIDRLIVSGKTVTIVDYKTNRTAPLDAGHVPEAYLYQLAAYTLALAEIYPNHDILAALIWTRVARLMPIPGPTLEHYRSRLWDLDIKAIDGSTPAS